MRRGRAGTWLLHAALVLGALAALTPMVWMVSASLMPTGEASAYPPRFFPRTVTFAHYTDLFTRLELGRYLLNSTLISLVVTAVSLAITALGQFFVVSDHQDVELLRHAIHDARL